MMPYIIKFWKYRELLYQLVIRDLRVKYRRSVLGYAWSLLNPLLMMAVISIVFSYMFRFEIDNYPMYLLTGLILYNFFNEATTLSMSSIINGGSLIRKVSLPKYIFPLSRTVSSFINLLFSLVAIIIMFAITWTPISWTIIFFPLPLIYLFIFALGAGMILSVLSVYYRDIMHLYGVILTAWMYLTPIFYPAHILPELPRALMKFNPLFHYIAVFREVVLYGQVPTLRSNLVCLAFSITSLLVGLYVFKKAQDKFVLYL